MTPTLPTPGDVPELQNDEIHALTKALQCMAEAHVTAVRRSEQWAYEADCWFAAHGDLAGRVEAINKAGRHRQQDTEAKLDAAQAEISRLEQQQPKYEEMRAKLLAYITKLETQLADLHRSYVASQANVVRLTERVSELEGHPGESAEPLIWSPLPQVPGQLEATFPATNQPRSGVSMTVDTPGQPAG